MMAVNGFNRYIPKQMRKQPLVMRAILEFRRRKISIFA
jgi:hypothetical protein